MRKIKAAALAALTALSLAGTSAPATSAQQPAGQEGVVKAWDARSNPPRITRTGQPQEWANQVDHKTVLSYNVYSPSMRRDIPVAVVPATDAAGNRVRNAPTLYLLNGAGGSEQNTDWVAQAFDQMYATYGRAGVNVVVPMRTGWPILSGVADVIRFPSTKVPFVDSRSWIAQASPRSSSRAWWLDV
mgnify:CR=1 FL=1